MGFLRIFLVSLCLASGAFADSVTVFAAASLKTALDEVAETFEHETGHKVVLSFAGSSALARQIQYGAPANLFISANSNWMDHIEDQQLTVPESRVALLSNQLVLIGHGQASDANVTFETPLRQMLGQGRLAMAMVQSVPAGIYGREALKGLSLWGQVADQVAQTDNVRAALALVALGEAPLGIVYASDALAEPRVEILGRFPAQSHSPIRYPAALIASGATPAAQELLDFLQSDDAREIFLNHGFQDPQK